jgi:hypothetical protein
MSSAYPLLVTGNSLTTGTASVGSLTATNFVTTSNFQVNSNAYLYNSINLGSGANLYVDNTAVISFAALAKLTLPQANIVTTQGYTGTAGQIRCVTNSPTQAGRLCYWSTTSNSWRYISDDSAV